MTAGGADPIHMMRLWRRFRASRAAAVPEYALVFSILLGGSLAVYSTLEDRSQATVVTNASAIGALPTIEGFAIPDGTSGTTTTTTGGSTTTGSTTTAGPTTTVVPTTTTAPTTTSTTTTTIPPTTTAVTWDAGWSNGTTRVWRDSCRCYSYAARWTLTVTSSAGVPLSSGWVRFQVERQGSSPFTDSWRQLNGSGSVTLTWSNRRSRDFPILITIVDLEDSSGNPISANPSSFSVTEP